MSERSKTVDIDIPTYTTGIQLIEAEAARIFLNLEDHSNVEVAYLFGLDRFYTSTGSMRGAISKAYNMVLTDPMKYDIPLDKAGFIQAMVESRQIVKKDPETVRELEEMEKLDINTLMLSNRDVAAQLVRRKLEYLKGSPKALKEEKLKDLVYVLGHLFDKGQIVQGQATEHVVFMSNLPEKMNPDEALKAILQMREEFNQDKNK